MLVSTVEVVFLVIAIAALLLPVAIEALKRPRIEVIAHDWRGQTSTPWHFATAHVRNRALHSALARLLVRQSATAATATIEFRKGGAKVLPEIAGRWSSRPEPLRFEMVDDQGIAVVAAKSGQQAPPITRVVYDLTLVPATLTLDLAPGKWEEVAVAILHDGGDAYAFGAESYGYGPPPFSNPAWKLDRAEYDVTVTVQSSGVSATRTFKLDNLAADFSRFKLI